MNYDHITIEDCMVLYTMNGTRVILENGQMVGFEEDNP